MVGHVKCVESTSEILAMDSGEDERASHSPVNRERISAESAELTQMPYPHIQEYHRLWT